jgi:hypothetical protein
MTAERVHIASGDRIPAEWGPPREAKRRTTVSIRAPDGMEIFDKPWGRLSAKPGEDWVVTEASGDEYPIKRAIFARTYEEVAPGRYRKSARSRLIQVPQGFVAVLATLEGEIEVAHPDYIAIGPDNEVYANALAWVRTHLDFVA